MNTVRIMLLTFFLSSVIIFPSILGFYDNIWNSQYLKDIKPDSGINHLRGTELIHHMAIHYYFGFGVLCGFAYLVLSGLSAILRKKEKSSNVLNLKEEGNVNNNAEPLVFKAGNIIVLSIFGATALIILFLIVLLFIEFNR